MDSFGQFWTELDKKLCYNGIVKDEIESIVRAIWRCFFLTLVIGGMI